jgi:hypothetical protein
LLVFVHAAELRATTTAAHTDGARAAVRDERATRDVPEFPTRAAWQVSSP